jgi:dTDP-4-dehydrorhamnose reductase
VVKKILVIGSGGKLGPYLLKKLGSRAVGTNRKATSQGLTFDLLTQRIGDVLVDPENFSHAIILAGITLVDEVAADPKKAREINVGATWILINDLIDIGIIPIFTSSDAVLGIGKGPFNENAAVKPLQKYGQFKHEIEKRILERPENWLVLRLSKVYDFEIDSKNFFLSQLCHKIIAGGSITIATDLQFSPIFSEDFAMAVESAIDQKLTGLYHLGGPESVTYLDVANYLINELVKIRTLNVKLDPKSINEISPLEVRQTDIRMNSDKIMNTLDLQFKTVAESCRLFIDTHFK